ncbi:MAG TPA: heme lyase CcmF/NrfE family subunit [Telluria sp.]|jgi:cytochrome c-type biogenesis protein CcmF
MIPEIGNFAVMLALCVSLLLGVVPLVGAWRNDAPSIAFARPAAYALAALVVFAFGCLVASFVANDFSVVYVTANSNSTLPVHLRVAAAWGGHEGSLLLWILISSLWTAAVAAFSATLPPPVRARVLAVLGLIGAAFICFLLFTSNPFARQLPAAIDGRDLNPLLQDFGMIIHPPLLYCGYVGFSVAFAFAVASLLGGQADAAWARWSRPWTLVAWLFLTLGIFLGSFWAYYELGWGGWWFWDAVENASFMPWLVGTALIHSLAVTEKRGSFRGWTILLAISAFSLSLLGTFLVRSGVLTSVHAFASDPRRGLFILMILVGVIGGSLTLFAWRAPRLERGGRFTLFSRESALLLNNVLLAVAAATVLLGTLYPLILDAFGLGKISVGPPYFEAVFVPLMIPVLLLLGVGPFIQWKEAAPAAVRRKLQGVAVVALLIAAFSALKFAPGVALGLGLASWVWLATAWHLLEQVRGGAGALRRLRQLPGSYVGMLVAHAGIGVFVAGVTLVKGLETSADVRLRVGETVSVGDYQFRLAALNRIEGPNYVATQGEFVAQAGDRPVATLLPEKRVFTVQNTTMTEAAIDRGFTRDLYLALGEKIDATTWTVRIQHKPFVGWIWAGCLIMAVGGAFAALDRRYRARRVAPVPQQDALAGVAA